YKFNNYRGFSEINRINAINAAIKKIPGDSDMPVMTNFFITSHVSNRKYVRDFDRGTAAEAFNPIIRNNVKVFYLLYDSKGDAVINAARMKDANKQFVDFNCLSKKLGYNSDVIYESNNVYLYKFESSAV